MSGELPPHDPWAAPSTDLPLSPQPPAPAAPYPSPYPYGYPTYVPVTPPGPRRTDPVSVVALVCGCILLFPLALVLGIVGVVRTRRPDLAGRGLAVAGIVLGVVGALLGVVAAATFAFLSSDTGKEVVAVASGDQVFVEDLAEGDCFQTPARDEAIGLIDTIGCGLPHDLEVFLIDEQAFTPAESGAPYPGVPILDKQAASICTSHFTAFVGTPYDSSVLDFYVVYPSEDTWDRFDDRGLICAVGDPTKKTTGTLENSQR